MTMVISMAKIIIIIISYY